MAHSCLKIGTHDMNHMAFEEKLLYEIFLYKGFIQ